MEQRERDAEARATAYLAAGEARKAQAAVVQQEASAEAAVAADARISALAEVRAKVDAESKARSDEESARARDLDEPRRRPGRKPGPSAPYSAPQKCWSPRTRRSKRSPSLRPKPRAPRQWHLHKPANTGRPPSTTAAAAPGAGKEVKSAKLSSSWAGDAAKKKAIPTRGDASGGVGRNNWRSGPRGRRGSDRAHDREDHSQAAPVEARVIEVHVPETITVAELAHKMAVKAGEGIRR